MTTQAEQLQYVQGCRAATERYVQFLRNQLATWRATDSGDASVMGRLRSALWWSVTEAWVRRIEGTITRLEQEVASLRAQEATLQQAPKPKSGLFGFMRR